MLPSGIIQYIILRSALFSLSLILLSSSIFKPTSCALPCLRKCATVNVFNGLYWAPPMSTASASSTASLHIPCLRLSAGQSLTRGGLSLNSYISESEARDKAQFFIPSHADLGSEYSELTQYAFGSIRLFLCYFEIALKSHHPNPILPST